MPVCTNLTTSLHGQEVTQGQFKRSLIGLNSDFSFYKIGCHTVVCILSHIFIIYCCLLLQMFLKNHVHIDFTMHFQPFSFGI